MAKQKLNSDHIIYEFETARFRCIRCNETFAVQLPMEISLFAKKSKAFGVLHIDCTKKESKSMLP